MTATVLSEGAQVTRERLCRVIVLASAAVLLSSVPVGASSAPVSAVPVRVAVRSGNPGGAPLPNNPGRLDKRALNDVDFDSATSGWTVGGWTPDSDARSFTVAKQWNGTAWRARPTVNPGGMANTLYGVDSLAADDAWAVGLYEVSLESPFLPLLEHWDGTTWSQVSAPGSETQGLLWAVDDSGPDDVWVVGSGGPGGPPGTFTSIIAHWDGSTWTDVTHPNPGNNGLTAVSVVSSDDVWAVGFSGGGPLVEHFNGRHWSKVQSNTPAGTRFWGVDAVSSDDVWAVGQIDEDGHGDGPVVVDHWDGTRWTVAHTPRLHDDNSYLEDVQAVSPTDVWAVGGRGNTTTDTGRTLIEHWDGTHWSVVPSPNRERPDVRGHTQSLLGVGVVDATDAWAVGQFKRNDTNYKTKWMLAHWNGTTWTNVRLH